MGSQTASSNDRSRMSWTPLMERYFIDLMLEHLHRGDRVGHTFNKQAWTDMLTLFNAKFGSQYDKDVLKSRYTNLWKQFNDVKNILCHIGFSWDAAHQMVVADDFVWDAYIKAHPDARCYRTKSVLNFDDLCVIYGHTTADGRYSLSSHDVSIDDEVQGLNVGDRMGSIAPSSNERPRTDWTTAMDQFFIELLLDQLGRGNKVNNAFNKNAWTDMLSMFNAKFGNQHGKRILKHRFKKLLKYYCDITNLLKQGFSWDEQQQMLAADDDVWDAYVKAHPHARTYRLKTLPNYRDLELIFGNVSDDKISNSHQEKSHKDVVSEIKTGEGKGSRNPSGTDRTRTYWTPAMDRCLIDLLLEQVKNGNKLGQTFITQAWNDMIASFNECFKSHYDKDVLKNRYKHLRKQFNEIDKLLQQSGFSWDDTREMVAAEDHVWDAYTKVHPEARSLRVKTLPGYHKLCVIFGEESSDTRYNRLSLNSDLSAELPMLITGEQKNGSFASVYDAASKIEWTESMEYCFVDLMIEQVNRGNRIINSFNEEAWTHMIEAFSAKLGLQCDKQFLEDQYFCLMKQHDDISNLLSHTGFAWDETLQMVTAENDIWDAYIKDHPDAISYKNRFLYLYPDLCKIFGNKVSDARVSALGQLQLMEANDITIEMDMDGMCENLVVIGNAEISDRDTETPREMDMDGSSRNLVVTGNTEVSYQGTKRPNETDMVGTSGNLDVTSNTEISDHDRERPREMNMDGTYGNLVVTGNNEIVDQDKKRPDKLDADGTCGNLVVTGNTEISYRDKRRPSTMPLNFRPPKKTPKKDLRMQEALSEMAGAVKALMNKRERNNNKSFENALRALQAMPDMDEEIVMDACDLLEDERKAKTFLALDSSLRKKWLLRKLRQ